uniref:Uncharacterized protein n=1 Tax=Nelumbo nucifera TaxID=4432 RepID=A0A822Z5W5_NELNU|nr:TPA_asm: hypothetical protein HUJ06_009027 [Nelumbo nucifera]
MPMFKFFDIISANHISRTLNSAVLELAHCM